MQKRQFLKLSSTMLATPLLSPLVKLMPAEPLKNWAGNIEYSTERLYKANSVKAAQKLVTQYEKVKVLGTRHCFNTIADSQHNLLSVRDMSQVLSFDPKAKTVTVGAGMSYGQLAPFLEKQGMALHNLASLPHISVAGEPLRRHRTGPA